MNTLSRANRLKKPVTVLRVEFATVNTGPRLLLGLPTAAVPISRPRCFTLPVSRLRLDGQINTLSRCPRLLWKAASHGPLKICRSHDIINVQDNARHFDRARFHYCLSEARAPRDGSKLLVRVTRVLGYYSISCGQAC